MFIKSGGFPLLKLRIAKDEYLPGYMANQLLYGARGKAQFSFAESDPDIRSISWRKISDIQGLVERADMSLPSLHECIMGHTLYPYWAWCLSEKDAQKLYKQYAYSTEGPEHGHRKRSIGVAHKSLTGLIWCKQCVSAHTSGALYAFPIWHRLHFAPQILVCHVHRTPLSTFCDGCLDRSRDDPSNWTPTLECLCPSELKDRVQMGEKMLNAMCDITSKAYEILQGEAPPEFTPLAIKQAIRRRLPRGYFRKGESRVTQILDAVIENIGEDAAEILEFNEHTVNLFITGENALSIKNPIQILAFGYATFNGFDGLMETINGSTKWILPSRPTEPFGNKRIRIRGPLNHPTREEFESSVAKMTLKEKRKLEQEGRAWLRGKIQQHPNLTRYEFWNSHRSRTSKFFYLVWIDTEWYRMMLPSAISASTTESSAAKLKSSAEITSGLIYERHANVLKDDPLRRITKSILMQPLDAREIRSIERYNPELRDALSACIDQTDGYKKRAARTLSQMVSKLQPNHRYADVNWYLDTRGTGFYRRVTAAKQWLFNFKDQH